MNYDTITFSLEDGIAAITLNRADVMNALNTQMRAEITHAVTESGTKSRVVVLTGSGRAFCSGQDLGDRANAGNLDLERTLHDEYEPMIKSIINCPVPTLAAVNGAAAGAGANLALACDVVIATESAYFLQAFTRIGLIPDAGGSYTLPRTMGMAKAMGAALFSDKIGARDADNWGLIWEAVDDEAFEGHWKSRASHLAHGPTKSYESVKRIIRASWNNDLKSQLNLEASEQGKCGKSRDFREGVLAFVEKRTPNFEGR
ncbi:MAG: 2-(1,2-epoxy-1,2-dihydrophenyl)acetyl-CoA isomerase [Tateyamaria sp.]|nr:2-(1,2-epoxy-1,2-dihydrophenyl)acetyl-CoA isomerase [Tateyamaria sp.]